jgi:hypothetical protein
MGGGGQPIAWPLWGVAGFERTIPVFERRKAERALGQSVPTALVQDPAINYTGPQGVLQEIVIVFF